MEQGPVLASQPTFDFGALRVDVDALRDGDDDEEQCVLSPLAQAFSPRPKKKEKKDRACPRRRRRKRAQQGTEGASVASSSSDSPGSVGDKVIEAGPPRPSPLSPTCPASFASPSSPPKSSGSPPTRQPATLPPPPPSRPRTPPHVVETALKSPIISSKAPPSKGMGGKARKAGSFLVEATTIITPSSGRCKQSTYLRSFFPAVSVDREVLPSPITDDDWNALEQAERQRWQEWAIFAAEKERARRMMELRMIEEEEARERKKRREWAKRAIEEEQRKRMQDQFVHTMTNTQWFADAISSFCEKYEVVCPYSSLGCRHICLRHELEEHLRSCCKFGTEKQQPRVEDTSQYEVICPNAILGCQHSCPREAVAEHLQRCHFRGPTRGEEQEERNHWKRIVIEETEEERARRVADGYKEFTMSEKRGSLQRLLEGQIHGAVSALHREVVEFSAICSRVEAEHRPAREAVVSHLKTAVSQLWPNATAEAYGSHATGLMSIGSDLDVVVCGYSEAGGGADKDPLQRLAAHLRGVSWIEITKVLDHTRVPLIKLVARLDGYAEVRVDLSMEGPSHTGLATASLVSTLASRLPPLVPLTLILKHLLRSRGLADPYTGGVPSYGLTLMVTFLLLRSRHACHSAKTTPATTAEAAESPPAPPTPPQVQQSGVSPSRPPSRSSQAHCGGAGPSSSSGAHVAKALATSSSAKPGPAQGLPATASTSIGVSPPRRGSAAALLRSSAAAREAEALLHQGAPEGCSDALPPLPVPPPQHRWSGAYAAEQQRRFGVRVAESVLGQVTWPAGEPEAPVLGQLLMDFFHLFGEDFEHGAEGLSVRAGGFRFPCKAHPPHPLASDPVVIEDPINIMNNVARSCYRIQAVQRAFAEALSNLRALVVRYNESATGRGGILMSPRAAAAAASESSLARESILFHICHIDLYEFGGVAVKTSDGQQEQQQPATVTADTPRVA